MGESLRSIKDLFLEALELEPEARLAYLDRLRREDAPRCGRVEALLAAADEADQDWSVGLGGIAPDVLGAEGAAPKRGSWGSSRRCSGRPAGMSFSPDGALLAVASWRNRVLVWDLAEIRRQLELAGIESW